MTKEVIAPGANILVRNAAWRVQRVDNTSNNGKLITAIGISELVRDREALFLDEYEPDIKVLDPAATELVRDNSSNFQRSLLYMESQLRRIPPTDDHLYIGHKAAMDVLDFQLQPAALALSKPRQRILIADAVGLGKTMEAGILLSELIARGKGKRILVVTVKSMLTQFQKELWSRFTIPLVRLDSIGLQRIRSRIPTNQNPFYYYDKTIISVDTLKQNNEYRTYLEKTKWDIIVIDEAHNVAARGNNKSQRARLAELLSREASDTLIMLSATPHDGKARSFASLMNMLDPTAIANPDEYESKDIDGLFIRRFKKDIAHEITGQFPERQIHKIKAQATPAEERAFHTFADLKFTTLDKQRGANMLVKTTIEKALLSSPAACIETIDNRVKTLKKRDDHDEVALDIAALTQLRHDLTAVQSEEFGKYQQLLSMLQNKKDPFYFTGKGADDRLVIFTERIETMKWLAARLPAALNLKADAVEVLHGTMSDIDQQRIVDEFGKEKSAIRLLIASDVASEGINLHYYCHRMVHFDIPWSLLTFQQRNGRIDRYGQTKVPHIAYLYSESENERIRGDVRILTLLIEKDEQARKNIGDPSALQGAYDVEDQENITANAIESGQADALFDPAFEKGDLFSQLLAAASEAPAQTKIRRAELASLYANDFEYLTHALHVIREDTNIDVDIDANRQRISFPIPDSLRRRFEKMPDEVLPEDNRLILTADIKAAQDSIIQARGEESSWPAVQFLWRLNPVVQWANDHMTAAFGRHVAPIITLGTGLEKDERVFVLSGLLPNRKSQPVIHRWFGVVFHGDTFQRVETFEALRKRIKLGTQKIANTQPDLNTTPLEKLLPAAVQAISARMLELRAEFENDINPRLNEELTKLEILKGRQLQFAQQSFDLGRGSESVRQEELQGKKRNIDRIFDDYYQWVEDTMVIERTPFIQVIAAIVAAN